jgi:ATP-dependent exoDNAse (exonuclease V) beta subunit
VLPIRRPTEVKYLARIEVGERFDDIEIIARAHGRRIRASDEEIIAATTAARHVMEHPAIKSTNKQVLREFPFVLRIDGREIIEGMIDFAIRSKSGWLLFDFKVGRADLAAYDRQMQIYAAALRKASALPVRACLIEIT